MYQGHRVKVAGAIESVSIYSVRGWSACDRKAISFQFYAFLFTKITHS